MEIHEISREECLRMLAGRRLARLACAVRTSPISSPSTLLTMKPPVVFMDSRHLARKSSGCVPTR